MTLLHSVRPAARVALAGVLALGAVSCSQEPDDELSDTAATTRDDPFVTEASESGQLVYGHGLAFEVPEEWEEWGPEDTTLLGMHEWVIQAPDSTGAFAHHVSVTAGTEEVSDVEFETAPQSLIDTQSLNDTFELVDEGTVEISGAVDAYRVHIRSETMAEPPDGGDAELAHVETWVVFLSMPGGQATTVRFHAPVGEFEDSDLMGVYESLRVVEELPSA